MFVTDPTKGCPLEMTNLWPDRSSHYFPVSDQPTLVNNADPPELDTARLD